MSPEYTGREGEKIYTRNYGKPSRDGTKYSPPPGYDGNAFPQTPDVKLHEAEDDVTDLRRSREPVRKRPEDAAERFDDALPDLPEPQEPPVREAETEEERLPKKEALPEPDFGAEPGKLPSAGAAPVFADGVQALESLFRHLRGKFGREELIIVLVMLLISSEGGSLELLLLALILIAG